MGVLVGLAAGALFSSTVGTAAAVVAFAGVEGAMILGAIGGAVVSGLVGRALGGNNQQQQEQQFLQAARGVLINNTSNVGPIPVIYGSRRTGGYQLPPIVIGTNNDVLVLVTFFSEGPISAINTVYFDGIPSSDQKFSGLVLYQSKHLGSDSEPANPYLLRNVPGWSANDRFLGVAYLLTAIVWNQTAFPTGKPIITADIDGRLLYDPRDAGTRFSNNPALVIRDYHAHAIYGRGIASANIDDTEFSTAATDCEARVTLTSPTFTADASTDRLTFAVAQTFSLAAEVQVSNSGGGLPAGLAANTVYFWIPVSTTLGKLALTPADAAAGTAIDLTTAGTGTHTLMRAPIFVADPDTDLISFDHDEIFGLGDGVRVLTSDVAPGGLSVATTYYFIPHGVSPINGRENPAGVAVAGLAMNCGYLATTFVNALAGTAIDITSGGTGTHSVYHVDMQRYSCDGVLNPDDGWLNNLRVLLSSCRGIRPFTGGKYRLRIDKLTTPTVFGFTEDNIVGAWTIQGRGRKSSFNRITAQFFNPAKNWQPDLAIFDASADRTIDNGALLESKISLMMTTSFMRTMMIAQIEEQQSRFGTIIQFRATIAGMQCEVGDVVPITESGYGWTAKPFRIMQIELYSSDEVQITCREYDDSVYNVTTIPQGRTYPVTTLPDPFTIARQIPPTVSGLEIFGQGRDTVFTGKHCKFAWRIGAIGGSSEFGSEPFGADGGLRDFYFKDFRIRICRTDGTLLREEWVQDPSYIYTYEHNSDDNGGVPVREFTISVWQRTKYDQISEFPATLSVSNPLPLSSAPSATASVKGVLFTFTKSTDTDFAGYKLWGSVIDGFTPDALTLLYNGFDTEKVIGNLTTATPFYYRYCISDTFGDAPTSIQYTVSPGVLALSEDLSVGATTVLSQTIDFSTTTQHPNAPQSSILCAWIAAEPRDAYTSDYVEFTGTFTASAASNNTLQFDIYTFASHNRYTTGTIASHDAGTVVGSGTAWLSAGLSAGDILVFANGYNLLKIVTITNDTHLACDSILGNISGGAPHNSYSGPYIIFKGGTIFPTTYMNASFTASVPTQVSLIDVGAGGSDAGVTEHVYFFFVTPIVVSPVSVPWYTNVYLTQLNVSAQVFRSIR